MNTQIFGKGLFAWIEQNSQGVTVDRLHALMREAQHEAWMEFVTGKTQSDGLPGRFSPKAWDLLGLTRRSKSYEQRKMRVFGGRDVPYTSPRKGGTAHMRDLLKVKGSGFNLTPRSGGDVVTTTLKLPGARILNFVRNPQGAIYRSEFLQLTARARAEGDQIRLRAQTLFWQKFTNEVETTGSSKVTP